MKLKYDFEFTDVCGSYMAVAVGENAEACKTIIHLNSTGKRIVELIKEQMPEDEIVSLLQEEYYATEVELKTAVRKVVQSLDDAGFIL